MSSLIQRVQAYLEEKNSDPTVLCRVYMRRIEHLYYKVGVALVGGVGYGGGEKEATDDQNPTLKFHELITNELFNPDALLLR